MVSVLKDPSLILCLSCCHLGHVSWHYLSSGSLVLQSLASFQFCLDYALSVLLFPDLSFPADACLLHSLSTFSLITVAVIAKLLRRHLNTLADNLKKKSSCFCGCLSSCSDSSKRQLRCELSLFHWRNSFSSLPLSLVFFLNTSDKCLWLVVLLCTNGPAPYLGEPLVQFDCQHAAFFLCRHSNPFSFAPGEMQMEGVFRLCSLPSSVKMENIEKNIQLLNLPFVLS